MFVLRVWFCSLRTLVDGDWLKRYGSKPDVGQSSRQAMFSVVKSMAKSSETVDSTVAIPFIKATAIIMGIINRKRFFTVNN